MPYDLIDPSLTSPAFTRASRSRTALRQSDPRILSRSRSPKSQPADLSQPSTSRQTNRPHSTINRSSFCIEYVKKVFTPKVCQSVAFHPNGDVIHGGDGYDSLGLTSDMDVFCIRMVGDDIVMLVRDLIESDTDCDTDENTDTREDAAAIRIGQTAVRCVSGCYGHHVVTYRRDSPGDYREYQLVSKICCIHPNGNKFDSFSVASDCLYISFPQSIYIYDFNSGERLGELKHPDWERLGGICSSEDGRVFVTDFDTGVIFSFHAGDPEKAITKFCSKIKDPANIIIYRDQLLVASRGFIHIINMETGKKVKRVDIGIRRVEPFDISVNDSGRLAVALYYKNLYRGDNLYHLFQIEDQRK